MRKKSKENELVLLESGFLLREIFRDNYEYEAYFRLINSVDLNDYFPSELEIEFERGGKGSERNPCSRGREKHGLKPRCDPRDGGRRARSQTQGRRMICR